ncbi:MAG: MmgE/PrpD family protein [Gammaproteobacteria bacterium]|nr:MmgE/PrpD family protein [Gammaproteobacteria bacterium]
MSSSKAPPSNITHRLVEHVTQQRYERLSKAAVESTKTFILDSLGVALSGTRVPMVRELEAVAAEWGSGKAARIWGTGRRVPAATAAFINGYQIHNQEWDCVHEPAVVHPMAVVLSTLLAWCEAQGGVNAPIDHGLQCCRRRRDRHRPCRAQQAALFPAGHVRCSRGDGWPREYRGSRCRHHA